MLSLMDPRNNITTHALERFTQRSGFRGGVDAARVELEALIDDSWPARGRDLERLDLTPPATTARLARYGSRRLALAMSADGAVVTVLLWRFRRSRPKRHDFLEGSA